MRHALDAQALAPDAPDGDAVRHALDAQALAPDAHAPRHGREEWRGWKGRGGAGGGMDILCFLSVLQITC